MTHETLDAPDSLTIRSPEDMLALVPLVLGFEAEESVVMLTLGGAGHFHARVDLPRDPAEVPDVVDALLAPAVRHRVAAVSFVLLGADAAGCDVLAHDLREAFVGAGIVVVECLRAHGGRFRSLVPGRRSPAEGIAYDISNHPFVVRAVLRGQVTHPSRAALAATLRRDEVAARKVCGALPAPGRPCDDPAETAWAVQTVRAALATADSAWTVPEVARLLAALHRVAVRDAVWLLLRRDNAREWVDLWTRVVQRAPAGFTAAPATLLAFGAWVGGHGALAWCALDVSEGDDPDYPLASLLAAGLHQALPPSAWETMRAEVGPDPA